MIKFSSVITDKNYLEGNRGSILACSDSQVITDVIFANGGQSSKTQLKLLFQFL